MDNMEDTQETSRALVIWPEARRLIQEARNLDEIKQIRDKAEALRLYLKQQKESHEAQNECAEIKVRAERRAGEILSETEKAKGTQGQLLIGSKRTGGRTVIPPVDNSAPKLSDLGISKSQSSHWQGIADLPEPIFETFIASTKAKGKELTSAGLHRIVKRERRKKKEKNKPRIVINAPSSPRLLIARAEDMSEIARESVDLIITSPPYNLHRERWPMGGGDELASREVRADGIGYDQHGDNMPEDQYQLWQLAVLGELYRVAKPGASFFYNHKIRQFEGEIIHPLDWLRDPHNPWTLRQEIIWDRGSTHNHSSGLFWQHDERIYWFTKGKPVLPDHPIGMSTIWQFHGPVANTWHPAPFHEELPRRCIQAVGREQITVLDPFAGSCTTIKVALEYGYDAIGVDISQEYIQRAKEEYGWQ